MNARLAILVIMLAVTIGLFIGLKGPQLRQDDKPTASPTGLTVCPSQLDEGVIQAEYNERVRRSLDIGTEADPAELGHLLVRAVEIPGWADPEWAVSIVVLGDGQAMVQVVEAESSVWIANSGGEGGRHLTVQPVPVSSTRASTTVPSDLAQELGRIWREELLEVAPRDDNQLPVLDGSTY